MNILSHNDIIAYLDNFNPINYCKTRNYITGWVSKLSPYITHGVITIDEIIRHSLKRYPIDKAEQRYKELLWREYFVQVHYHQWDKIFDDMEEDKTNIPKHDLLPETIKSKSFSSWWVNRTILELEQTGYLHNHQRMRLASYMIHRQKLYRKKLADWSYYHFLDGELWSNHLSWQRVASTFAHKAYIMNEDNLKRYRPGTSDPYLRHEYEQLAEVIFDPHRTSDVKNDRDISDTLQTDLSAITHWDIHDYTNNHQSWQTVTVLTPWDFHPDKIQHSASVCIIDQDFVKKHPWSDQRVQFVRDYAQHYDIPLYQWSVSTLVTDLITRWYNITCYETRNPVYKETYHTHQDTITCIPHKRCAQTVTQKFIKKFFPFWEKNSKYLYQLQREILWS